MFEKTNEEVSITIVEKEEIQEIKQVLSSIKASVYHFIRSVVYVYIPLIILIVLIFKYDREGNLSWTLFSLIFVLSHFFLLLTLVIILYTSQTLMQKYNINTM